MRQLDLFGSLFETSAAPEEKKEQETTAVVLPPEEIIEIPLPDFKFQQHSVLQPEEKAADADKKEETLVTAFGSETETLLPEAKEPSNPIFFTDGKIGVKMKASLPAKPKEEVKQAPEKTVISKSAPTVHFPKEKKDTAKKLPQKRGRKSFKEIDAEVDLIDVPSDEVLFQKQYYSISQVALWFNVNTSLLRFWENEFTILKPRKNRKGDRLFRPEDVKNIQLIYELLRQKKYTVEGAKEYLKTNKDEADLQILLTQSLTKFRSFLLDLKANL